MIIDNIKNPKNDWYNKTFNEINSYLDEQERSREERRKMIEASTPKIEMRKGFHNSNFDDRPAHEKALYILNYLLSDINGE